METTSLTFAAFVLGVLLLYYMLPRRAQNPVLLAASYVFLARWDIRFALVYVILTAGNYVLALRIGEKGRTRRRSLQAGIALNVLVLLYFKYTGFFIDQAASAMQRLGYHPNLDSLALWLSIGLSFYVVQVISYLMDIYTGIATPTRNPITFALYMVYFPRVVSGPIERSRDLLPQLEQPRTVANTHLEISLTLLLRGILRKIVIADVLFLAIPSDLFEHPRNFSGPELAIWLLAYAFALYNDFAGYTAIARGISSLFGIQLVENFSAPYLARSFSDFWQRWHMSLSRWLWAYVFMPLTRAFLRRKRMRLSIIVPPLVTMLVSAAWHDLSWSMLVWGGLHGLYLIAERWTIQRRGAARGQTAPRWRQAGMTFLVFVGVVLAWIPFRTTLPNTIAYLTGLLSPGRWTEPGTGGLINAMTISTLLLIAFSFLLDQLQLRAERQETRERAIMVRALTYNAALLVIVIAVILQQDAPPPFIYQGF